MKKFDNWIEVRKGFNFSEEEENEIELEKKIIEAIIEARKSQKITQEELSKKTGIKQSAIARLESGKHIPNTSTLLKLLIPIGYTLQVVPINSVKNK